MNLSVYVHAVGTTGRHRAARRGHAHRAGCLQCGREVDERTRVAAHVVRYRRPLCCPCVGTLTLVTTCRACNSAHQADPDGAPEQCCVPRARIWRRARAAQPVVAGATRPASLGGVRTLWCWRHVTTRDEGGERGTYA